MSSAELFSQHAKREGVGILSPLNNPADLTFENVTPVMWTQRRLKSACASAQSDQSHSCPCEEISHH